MNTVDDAEESYPQDETYDEEHDYDDDDVEGQFQDAIRAELEGLSGEPQDAEVDLGDDLGPEGAQELETAAVNLASAHEALTTVRNARAALKGSGKGEQRPAIAGGKGRGKGQGRGRSSGKSITDRISDRKARSNCNDCGQRGHCAGDPGCPGPCESRGALATEIDEGDTYDVKRTDDDETRPAYAVAREVDFRAVLAANTIIVDDGIGVCDTACRDSDAGIPCGSRGTWTPRSLDNDHEVTEQGEDESYKFGNGGTLPSTRRVTVPFCTGDKPTKISFSVVDSPGPGLSLLISRDFLEGHRAVMDIARKTLRVGKYTAALVTARAGRFGLPLRPDAWSALNRMSAAPRQAGESDLAPAQMFLPQTHLRSGENPAQLFLPQMSAPPDLPRRLRPRQRTPNAERRDKQRVGSFGRGARDSRADYANLTLCLLSIYIVYDQFVIADETYVAEYKLVVAKYGKSDPVEFGKIGSANYVYYVDSYYYSTRNHVDFLIDQLNDLGTYNILTTVSCDYYYLYDMFHMRCKYWRCLDMRGVRNARVSTLLARRPLPQVLLWSRSRTSCVRARCPTTRRNRLHQEGRPETARRGTPTRREHGPQSSPTGRHQGVPHC